MARIWIMLLIVLSSRLSPAGDTDWSKSTGWALYNLYSQGGADQVPIDSLRRYDSTFLDMDTIRSYLAGVRPIPPERSAGAAWMGTYWASCNIGDTVKVLKVSTYGGFFVDQASGRYYEIPRPLRQAWLQYWRGQLRNLRQKKDNHGAGGG